MHITSTPAPASNSEFSKFDQKISSPEIQKPTTIVSRVPMTIAPSRTSNLGSFGAVIASVRKLFSPAQKIVPTEYEETDSMTEVSSKDGSYKSVDSLESSSVKSDLFKDAILIDAKFAAQERLKEDSMDYYLGSGSNDVPRKPHQIGCLLAYKMADAELNNPHSDLTSIRETYTKCDLSAQLGLQVGKCNLRIKNLLLMPKNQEVLDKLTKLKASRDEMNDILKSALEKGDVSPKQIKKSIAQANDAMGISNDDLWTQIKKERALDAG